MPPILPSENIMFFLNSWYNVRKKYGECGQVIITSAVKQKNNPDMISIYIDNKYAFSMPKEEYLKLNLYERNELTEEEIKKIREEINITAAKHNGIRMLYSKDRTEFEVRQKLIRQGFDEDTAEGAVMQLKSMGYINDRLYAHKYISDRLKLKPKSKKALMYELQKKGINKEIITEVLDEFEIDESLVAYRITKKRFSKYDISDPLIHRRIVSFLTHRGFSYEIINNVIKQLMQ
jgi:regulatory protein